MKKIASEKNYDLHKKAQLALDDKKELKNAFEYSTRLVKQYYEKWFQALPPAVALDISSIHGILSRLHQKYGQ